MATKNNFTVTSEYIEDAQGNRNYISHFGSKKAAKAALETLVDCGNCVNCSGCSGCLDCWDISGSKNFKDNKPAKRPLVFENFKWLKSRFSFSGFPQVDPKNEANNKFWGLGAKSNNINRHLESLLK